MVEYVFSNLGAKVQLFFDIRKLFCENLIILQAFLIFLYFEGGAGNAFFEFFNVRNRDQEVLRALHGGVITCLNAFAVLIHEKGLSAIVAHFDAETVPTGGYIVAVILVLGIFLVGKKRDKAVCYGE